MKVNKLAKKSKQLIKSIPAGIMRASENGRQGRIANTASDSGNPKPSVTIVYLPVAGARNDSSISAASGAGELRIDGSASIDEINKSLMSAKSDYLVFINGIVSGSESCIYNLIAGFDNAKDTCIIGGRSYYSSDSPLSRANLIKQEGILLSYTKKKNNVPVYKLNEKGHLNLTWSKGSSFEEMEVPSTDILAISTEHFKELGGFATYYHTDSFMQVLTDLCLMATAKGYKNHLSLEVSVAVKYEAARLNASFNASVFRGRWYRFLRDKEKGHSSLPELNGKEIDILGSMPDDERLKSWGDYHYSVALKNSLIKHGYKVNIVTKEHWYDKSSAKYVIVLRGLYPYYRPATGDNKKVLYWIISHPENIETAELTQPDHIFYASEKLREHFGSELSVPSGVLPQCTDPEVMKRSGKSTLSPELLFVGNSRKVYRRILKDLLPTDHELKIYGKDWDEFEDVKKYVVSNYLDNNIVADAYHNAAILLNDHWDDMREFGIISNRIFDALCASAFVISDEVAGIHDVLGDAVVTYKDPEDLKAKVDYYLSNPDARNEIAQKGQEIVIKNHTFDNRADEIVKIIEQI